MSPARENMFSNVGGNPSLLRLPSATEEAGERTDMSVSRRHADIGCWLLQQSMLLFACIPTNSGLRWRYVREYQIRRLLTRPSSASIRKSSTGEPEGCQCFQITAKVGAVRPQRRKRVMWHCTARILKDDMMKVGFIQSLWKMHRAFYFFHDIVYLTYTINCQRKSQSFYLSRISFLASNQLTYAGIRELVWSGRDQAKNLDSCSWQPKPSSTWRRALELLDARMYFVDLLSVSLCDVFWNQIESTMINSPLLARFELQWRKFLT